jgi:hypothetical protein
MTQRPASSAVLSGNGLYRYHLARQVSDRPGTLAFVMLNPSTADATTDDATIRRCRGFTKREGLGRLEVVNLFGLRTSSPRVLAASHADPIGADGNDYLLPTCQQATRVVAAWGVVPRTLTWRVLEVARLFGQAQIEVSCLGLTRDGWPRHPLRLAADTPLQPMRTWMVGG